MKRHKLARLLMLVLSLACIHARAEAVVLRKNTLDAKDYTTAKIVFEGEITSDAMMDLVSTLDEINMIYPGLKSIKLYINSEGGLVQSAYFAYEAIKSSRIPVTTINSGAVSSAATLVYCGGQERLAFPAATFLLHAPSVTNTLGDDLKGNHLELLKAGEKKGTDIMRDVYTQCTSLKKEELDGLLFSDDMAIFMKYDRAMKYGLASNKVSGVAATDVSYYLAAKQNN